MQNGSEQFMVNGHKIDISITDFWRWTYSDLSNDTNRSILAKFIVASALGFTRTSTEVAATPRKPYNLLSQDGYRIEVKSTAYIQSWNPEHPDWISFRIDKIARHSDVYIFCVYKAMYKNDSPLNLDLWDFYVLPAKTLHKKKPNKNIITLPSLMLLEPMWCDYYGIGETIRITMNA